MSPETFVRGLKATKEYFDRSSRCLEEKHSSFAPAEGSMTAAQQVAHVAQTVDWFIDGATRPEGFDLNFEHHMAEVMKVTSLKQARAWADRAFARAIDYAKSHTIEEPSEPLPEGMVMGGAPRFAIFSGIDDHTAHHRGALTVYSRLLGLTPPMPYMEMQSA